MNLQSTTLHRPHTVTFDCWATLLYEAESRRDPDERARVLAAACGASLEEARTALSSAWRRHQELWHRRTVFTGADMTRLALRTLGKSMEPEREGELIATLEAQILSHEVRALDGAQDALVGLARAGVRRALICDTGFTPGRVVRQLLDRVGLLHLLEVTVFSDEVGFPKPDRRAFLRALDGLGVDVEGAVHVGDLRRSDVAGARGVGMGSVRLRLRHDDADAEKRSSAGVIDCSAAGCDPVCERPEADSVSDSYPQLMQILGYG
jgi:putative hydrolase of the HAD superfamily